MDDKTYRIDEAKSECAVPVGASDEDRASTITASKPHKKTKRGNGFGDLKCPLTTVLKKDRKRERSTANRARRVAELVAALPSVSKPEKEETLPTEVMSPK